MYAGAPCHVCVRVVFCTDSSAAMAALVMESYPHAPVGDAASHNRIPSHHPTAAHADALPTCPYPPQVVDNPLDFYGGRLSGKERKATLTEQLLADADISYQRKRRYTKLQAEATKYSGAKRRKTDMPRDKKKKPRAKH